jgi:hypothetical protein
MIILIDRAAFKVIISVTESIVIELDSSGWRCLAYGGGAKSAKRAGPDH